MNWPIEAEALILCSRVQLNKEQSKKLKKILSMEHFNWSNFIDSLILHKVYGLAAKHLRELDVVPEGLKRILEILVAKNRENSRIYIMELKEIYKEFNASNLRVVLVKGPRLIKDVYPDSSLRTFGDLDLLINPEDFNMVKQILDNRQYIQGEVVNEEIVKMSDELLERYEKSLQHYGQFIRKSESEVVSWYGIDVHTRFTTVFDSAKFDTKRVLNDSVKTNFENVPIYVLNNTDHLIHLCLHLYWHTRSIYNIRLLDDLVLSRFVDIYESLKVMEIDWKEVLSILTKDEHLKIAVSYSLFLTEKIYGALMPDDIKIQLWNEAIEKHLDSIADRWTQDSDVVIGYWNTTFEERLFDRNRANKAYEVFYWYTFYNLEKSRGIQKHDS